MAEALLFVSVGSLLTVGAAILVVAALVLRNARRSVELAEYYLECLREEQARLLAFLSEEREIPKEEPKQEREQYLVEARQRAERLSRERLSPRQEQVRLAEELEQERAQHLEAQQQARHEREGRERERRARRDAERRMGQLKQELQKLRAAQQESFLPVPARSSKNLPETHELAGEKPSP